MDERGKLIAPVESFAPPPASSTLDQASIQPAPIPSKIDARIIDPHATTQKSEGDLDGESFVEGPRVDTNRQDSEELIDSREDSQCGQTHQSTRGQSSESTRGERARREAIHIRDKASTKTNGVAEAQLEAARTRRLRGQATGQSLASVSTSREEAVGQREADVEPLVYRKFY